MSWPIERHYFEEEKTDFEEEKTDFENGKPARAPGSGETVESWTDPLIGIGFIALPAGCFDMGDSTAGFVGEVCLDEFFLSRYEITNAQYRRFRTNHDSGAHLGHSLDDDDQPVVHVSWQDAMAFADWLSEQTGMTMRLATEAEWEYTCVYGWTEAATGKASTFGNLRASENDRGPERTVAVGSYQAGPQGVHDMHGNVSEWVLDTYMEEADRYGDDRNNPLIEAETPPLRVRKGGSWSSSVTQSRCAARDYYLGELAIPHTGFRLVAEPK